jgi:hypothetical protein
MKWNKKSASILAVLSLLLGSAGAMGLQVNAQQSSTQTPPTQIQTQSAVVGEQENSATDTDNIQDEQENGEEAKDGVEADENLPGGGHEDIGDNVDHQFEGVE